MSQSNVIIVSVVRDFGMYQRCVSDNPLNKGVCLVAIDNRTINDRIPVLYNRFLNRYDYSKPSWIVFCHEDFEFLEAPAEKVKTLDYGSIYGPIGGKLLCRHRWMLGGVWKGEYLGCIIQSAKDGSDRISVGSHVQTGSIVDALDCQCLIVHSSLICAHHLRFDENLSFDLYAEDFCNGAAALCGISTRVLDIKCHHYSYGNLSAHFFDQKVYLDAKYPKEEVFSPVGYTIGGGRTPLRRLQKRLRRVMDEKCPWLVKFIFKVLSMF